MPKVSIYLSDDLYRAVQEHDLPLSALAQEAVKVALRRRHNEEWVAALREMSPRVTERIDTSALMDEVGDEFGR